MISALCYGRTGVLFWHDKAAAKTGTNFYTLSSAIFSVQALMTLAIPILLATGNVYVCAHSIAIHRLISMVIAALQKLKDLFSLPTHLLPTDYSDAQYSLRLLLPFF